MQASSSKVLGGILIVREWKASLGRKRGSAFAMNKRLPKKAAMHKKPAVEKSRAGQLV